MNTTASIGEIYDEYYWGDVVGRRQIGKLQDTGKVLPEAKPSYSALIVEDDLSASHMIDVVLQSTGQFSRVDWVTSAEEAARMIRKSKKSSRVDPYNLIIIDIFLDGRETGVDLLNYLNEESLQQVPVIMTSGISEARFSELIGPYTIMPTFLQKPFQMRRCVQAIARAMNEPSWT
jgi:response regulator of citrate/malate metabolism